MAQYDNKTIIITGAAKGQGRAAAIAFAKEGANVVAFDLAQKLCYPAYNNTCKNDMECLKAEIAAFGGKVLLTFGDVRKADEVKVAVDAAYDTFGSVDILFNNAGICAYGLVHELPEQEWDTMMDINCKGAFLFCKYAVPYMQRQKRCYHQQFVYCRIARYEQALPLCRLQMGYGGFDKIAGY